METLQIGITALCLLTAVWLAVLVVRDRTPDRLTTAALAAAEVGLLVNLVLGLVKLSGDHGHVSVWTYVAYLVGVLLVLPVGLVWSAGEPSRGGTAVLLVAVLLVPFMFVRLGDIWAAGG